MHLRTPWRGAPAAFLVTLAVGLVLSAVLGPATASAAAQKLLFQSVCVTGTSQEYVSIYNPNNTAVDLSNYYITDAWYTADTWYLNIVNRAAGKAGGGSYTDWHIRFPAGATIAAHDTIAVSHQGASRFITSYSRKPAYEIAFSGADDASVPNMLPAFPGSVPGNPDSTTLTNGSESVVLYYWDGQTDLVTDVDYLVWGTTASVYVDKSGKSADGPDAGTTTTAYLNDTAQASQNPIPATHAFGSAFRREDYAEGTQKTSGGNGVDGRDETSENMGTTWSSTNAAAPPFVKGSVVTTLTAVPGGPYSGTAGSAVSFNGSASTPASGGTITAYAWTFGDGGTGTGATTTHTYTAAGSYTVTLTVTGSGGGTHSASTTATISGAATLTANPGGPYSGTVGTAVNFSGTGSTPAAGGTITAYAWTFGDGGTGTGATTTHAYTAAGSYTVTLTVTGSGGGTHSASTTATITTGGGGGTAQKLLFQSVCVTGTSQEYVSIYNPNNTAVDLSNYYITDAWYTADTWYLNIVNRAAGKAGGGTYTDWHIRFPAGATIAAHDTIAVTHQGASRFITSYSRKPAYEIAFSGADDASVPNMLPAFPGSVPGNPDSTTLTNGSESVVLYYWDGQTDLVTDVDYLVWGTTASVYVDKSGKSADGPDAGTTTTAYKNDTAQASQNPIAATHAFGSAFRREDYAEGTQKTSGGNGVDGRDETSENMGTTWSSTNAAAPPFVKGSVVTTLTARPGGPYTGKTGTAVSFNGSASTPASGGTITAYAWTFGDGGTGTGATPTHTYTATGTYTVTLTVTGSGGGTNSASTTCTITEPGAITAVPGGPYSGEVNKAITFNGSNSTPATGATITAYNWTFGDGGTGSGAIVTHTYTAAGTYTVTLTVTGSTATSNSASTTATVTAATVSTDVLQVPAKTFLPTRGETIEIGILVPSGSQNATLRVYDLEGREIRNLYDSTPTGLTKVTWNGRDTNLMLVPAGAYIASLEVRLSDGKVRTYAAPIVVARVLAR